MDIKNLALCEELTDEEMEAIAGGFVYTGSADTGAGSGYSANTYTGTSTSASSNYGYGYGYPTYTPPTYP